MSYEDVKKVCGGPKPSSEAAPGGNVETELESYTNKLKLFGLWR